MLWLQPLERQTIHIVLQCLTHLYRMLHRSFAFIHDGASAVMGWMRMPGDVIFLVGIFPLIKLAWLGIKEIFSKNSKETVLELPEPPLYEVVDDARIAEFAGAKAAEELPEQTSPYRSDRRG